MAPCGLPKAPVDAVILSGFEDLELQIRFNYVLFGVYLMGF